MFFIFAIMFLISKSFLSILWIFFFLLFDHGCHVLCYIWEDSSNSCFPLVFFSHAVIVLQVAFSPYSLWLFFVDPFLPAHWSESLKADWVWEWNMQIYSFTGWSWLTISCQAPDVIIFIYFLFSWSGVQFPERWRGLFRGGERDKGGRWWWL